MATKKESRAEWPQVYIRADRDDKQTYQPVAVNGRVYMIRKEEWIAVPPEVYEVIASSQINEKISARRVKDMIDDKEGKRKMGD